MDASAELLSVAETAERLGRSTEQVRRYLREGRLGGRRVGGQWFIPAADVEAFAPRRRAEASFLDRLRAAPDPLGSVIAIGRSGGGNVAAGKDAYRAAYRWRRS